MGDKGKKDKGKREHQKKAKLSPKEKRKLKREKKGPMPSAVRSLPREKNLFRQSVSDLSFNNLSKK